MLLGQWYYWGGANYELFQLINKPHSELSDVLCRGMAVLSDHNMAGLLGAVLLALALYYRIKGKLWEQATCLTTISIFVFSVGLNGVLLHFLKSHFSAPRPLEALRAIHFVATHSHSAASFPSGHAAFATLAAMCLAFQLPKSAKPWLVFYVVLAGLARINLGQHFPADVVYGVLSAMPFGLAGTSLGKHWIRPALCRLLKKDSLAADLHLPNS